MPSTATQWLLNNQSAADQLDQMLIEAGLPLDILTEYPDWMKEDVAKQLLESFNQPYWNDIAETFKGDAERYLRRGLDEGWSIRRIANSISEQLGDMALARATNIARTEAANALNGARRASMGAMIEELSPEFGGGNVPIRPVWLSVLGNTTRDSHADLDGVPADKDGMWELAGYRIPWPGHISLPPSERCNCQCTITVEFGLQDREAERLIQEYGRRVERQGKSIKHLPGQHNQMTHGRGGGGAYRTSDSEYYQAAKREHLEGYDVVKYGVPEEAHVFIQSWQYGVRGFEADHPVMPSDKALRQLVEFVPDEPSAVLYRAELVGGEKSEVRSFTRNKEFAKVLVEAGDGGERKLVRRRVYSNEMIYDSASFPENYRKDHMIEETVVAFGDTLKRMRQIRGMEGGKSHTSTKSTSYKPPEAARNNAHRVLKWREEHGDDVEGMTPVGWRRASQLASGEEISLDIVKRMAQFNRHRSNYRKARSRQRQEGKPPWKYAGIVAWLGWGGSSGVNWARRVSDGAKSVKRRDNHHVGPESTPNYWKLRQRIRSGKAKCYKCESNSNLVVHHMDGDVENDAMSNLRIVCDSCHRAAPDGPHAQSKHLPGQHNQMSHGRGGGSSGGGSVAALTKGSLSPDAIDHWGYGWNRRIGEHAIMLVGDEDAWGRIAEGCQVQKDGKTQAVCAFRERYNGHISEEGIELEYLASNMKGGGTKLMTEVCRIASERGMAVKLTSANAAIGFYQKMGMEQIPLPAYAEPVFMFTAEEAGRFYREHQNELKNTSDDLVALEPRDGVFVPGKHKKNNKREDRD